MLLRCFSAVSVVLSVLLCWGTGAFSGLQWLWLLPVGALGSFLLLAGLTFLLFWLACLFVRQDRPQETDSPLYRKMACLIAEALMPIVGIRMHLRGLEKTPVKGRFLLVCNHVSILDPVLLLDCFRKSQLAFISKRENASMFMVGKIMHKILCQMINRENDREALKTILKCVQLIRDDLVSIAVFPEGYTSLDGRLQPFRHGVFKIAQKTRVPIVVCTLQGTQDVLHRAARLQKTDVALHLVRVVMPEEYENKTTVELGEEIYRTMLEDLGPEYRPVEQKG